jgi:hypothetical protein
VWVRIRAQLRDRRDVEARNNEVRNHRIVQRAAGGRIGLRRKWSIAAAVAAAVAQADLAERPRLGALVAAATRWLAGADCHAGHHHALQHHHGYAGEQAAAELEHICVRRIDGGKVDVGPGVI